MATEQWRPIPGFDDRYEASDQGRIRSMWNGEGRVLSQAKSLDGYSRVSIRVRPKYWQPIEVHALVALAFYGERPTGFDVRHLDGDQSNNHVQNLRYGSKSENALDQVRHGTHAQARRKSCRRGHEYTPENTYIDSSGARVCRACGRKSAGRYSMRKRATR